MISLSQEEVVIKTVQERDVDGIWVDVQYIVHKVDSQNDTLFKLSFLYKVS